MENLKCIYCKKIIEGYKKSQVEYMMKQHLLSKHSDMIDIVEVKKK